jgi:hypothetical protein
MDCRQDITAPRLDSIYTSDKYTAEEKEFIQCWVFALFENCHDDFHTRLNGFRDTMGASLFMHFETVECDQPDSIVLQMDVECGRAAGASGSDEDIAKFAKEIGECIWDDFVSTNKEVCHLY